MTDHPSAMSRLTGLRGARYGEIFLIRSDGSQLTAAIYNTTGLNDCPPGRWQSLDPARLAGQFGVAAVQLNGPRFWALDGISAHGGGEIVSFGGLPARWVAELPIPPGLGVADDPAARYYRPITVRRDTRWHFAAGRPVHELLAPDGHRYVMQAYSHIIDAGLTLDSLPALGERLSLPAGWRYQVGTPDRELTLRTSDGQAEVLQDELQNTYMRLSGP